MLFIECQVVIFGDLTGNYKVIRKERGGYTEDI